MSKEVKKWDRQAQRLHLSSTSVLGEEPILPVKPISFFPKHIIYLRKWGFSQVLLLPQVERLGWGRRELKCGKGLDSRHMTLRNSTLPAYNLTCSAALRSENLCQQTHWSANTLRGLKALVPGHTGLYTQLGLDPKPVSCTTTHTFFLFWY